jgi:hypothetical protein
MRFQALFGAGDQAFGLIAGHLHDRDRQPVNGLLHGPCPSLAIPSVVILLQ